MSGVEEIASDQCTNVNVDTDSQRRREKGEGIKKKMLTSFVDPFEVTIDVTMEEDEDFEYESDEEYEPSFTFTLRPKQMKLAEDEDSYSDDNTESAQEDDDDDDDDEDDVDQVTETSQGENVENISRITTEEDVSGLLNDHVCLTYMQQLLVLANAKINSICHVSNCKGAVQVSKEVIGSALYLKWACPANHTNFKWCSQPLLNRRLHSGDLITSAAILLSGNNYGKIHLFAKMLNLKIVSKATFYKIQKHYLVPSIDEYWLKHQQNMIDKHKDKNLVVLGDGRMDSPGFCAQYCSYTMMENESKDILSLVTMDKRQTDRKSTNLEKACFQVSLSQLQDKEVEITEVVTDCHLQIGALMKRTYPGIKHSYDIWHVAKNLGKKIMKAGQDKQCKALLQWSQHIVTHFWYCCKKATSYDEFLGIWCGTLHHVVNEHTWILPYGQGMNKCDHGPLCEETVAEREWLNKNDPAHVALRKIVLDKAFLNKVPYFLNFRSTAELELFQQNILMYAAKRFAYTPPIYRVRNYWRQWTIILIMEGK
ncbi:uncharacterized protein [Ptychodera flava]|uniref:uncharacterized protein n=1 Tax=Ptychodera flava TaxID=63121 RepID=UPI00396A4CA9